uniref:Reverse transcriptase domain-containing protein n=1 Tax=Leptobrachium leishanense TaxID=445787 RepID=A0A8C5LQ70_9ANUR
MNDHCEYRKCRNECTKETKMAKAQYFNENLNNNISNPRNFWKIISNIQAPPSHSQPAALKVNNQTVQHPLDVANAFNNYFVGCATTLIAKLGNETQSERPHEGQDPPTVQKPRNPDLFSFRPVPVGAITKLLRNQKMKYQSGPDQIPAMLLKISAPAIAKPVATLINESLATGYIPILWKTARVVPIHKSGDNTLVSNYRPISLLPVMSKILEKCVYTQLRDYYQYQNYLTPDQSGFRPNHSTTTALLKVCNDIQAGMEQGNLTGAIFLDFAKAFDTVDHGILLQKLKNSGIGDSTLTWFQSYVSDRSQFVSISDSTSLPLPVTCGVPQGSILGPLLFTIFINDLPNVCKASTVHMYADDTVIYTSKPNLPQLEAVLQEEFTGVEKWIANNKLFLNTDKTVTMLFGTAPKLHKLQTPHLCVGTKSIGTLTTVTSLKYLGMWLDPNLSFGPHIEKLSSKLYPKLGALYRNKSCLSPAVRKQIVQQMLMPAIEYGDVVYAAAPQTHLQKLTTLYNSFCRFVLQCNYMTHHCDMLKELNWPSLDSRRTLHLSNLVFKSFSGKLPPYLNMLLPPAVPSSYNLRSRTSTLLAIPQYKKKMARSAFSYRAPQIWNNLPDAVKSSPSLKSLKSIPQYKMHL